jgi:hypothetical protein
MQGDTRTDRYVHNAAVVHALNKFFDEKPID